MLGFAFNSFRGRGVGGEGVGVDGTQKSKKKTQTESAFLLLFSCFCPGNGCFVSCTSNADMERKGGGDEEGGGEETGGGYIEDSTYF